MKLSLSKSLNWYRECGEAFSGAANYNFKTGGKIQMESHEEESDLFPSCLAESILHYIWKMVTCLCFDTCTGMELTFSRTPAFTLDGSMKISLLMPIQVAT